MLVHDLSTTTEVGDGDGFIEPGEPFRLNERLRNLGTATGDRDQRGARRPTEDDRDGARLALWPNIPANAVGDEHRPPFRARLASNYACGETAR